MTDEQRAKLKHACELAQAGVGTIVNHTAWWLDRPILRDAMEQLTDDLLKIIDDIEEATE